MIRVLIISHAYVSKYHQEKIETLAEYKDLEIFLMTPEFGIEGGGRKIYLEKTKDENYTIIPIKTYFSGKWNSYLIKGFKNYLRKIKPDIIHLEEEYWTNAAWQTQKELKKIPNTKLILFTWENIFHNWNREGKNLYPAPKLETQNYQSSSKLDIRKKKFWCWMYQKFRFAVFNFIEKKVLKRADIMIAGNEEAKNVLLKKGYKKTIEILPQFGVNQNYFKKKNVDGLKAELRLEDFFIAGYIGRITREKGIEDLIRAASNLIFEKTEQGRVKFLIIGNGSYKQEADNLVKELKIKQNIIFLPAVDFNQVVEYYNLMDLMIIPSRTTPEWKEQFGRTIVEAMSCGIPVIGSDSGAIPEVIGGAGLIFKQGNADDLADKINKIIDENKLRTDLIDKGLKRVKENFTTEIIAKKTYEIYKNLISHNSQE